MTYHEDDETYAIGLKLPYSKQNWHRKRVATDLVMDDVGGIVTRVGDETVGAGGKILDKCFGSNPKYTFQGEKNYVRATISDSNGFKAWIQPVHI